MCQNKGKHRDGEEESGSESLVKGGECPGEASVFKLVWGSLAGKIYHTGNN